MPAPPLPTDHAIFLSYASQDAEAARRICAALRAAGIEVWFDQNELRGGDQWDAKIRKQIRDCTLFLPVVSAHTQARLEGYFRLEWKLAEDRSHLMAKGKPFIVPVTIDATTERDAHVPDAFLAVQWTRLPLGPAQSPATTGEVPAAFVERVRGLLDPAAPLEPGRPRLAQREEGVASPSGQRVGRRVPAAAWGLAAIAAVFVIGLLMWRQPTGSGPIPAPHAGSGTRPPTAVKPPEDFADTKSLVVLPFENLSPDPENAFFTDGMHAEIIATLQRIPDLKVTSRYSSLAFKGANTSAAEFAQKVGATNIITGSVRREHAKVRIQLELRRARDDALLWAPLPYDRELKDVITIQSEIADEVARVLQARVAKGGTAARFMTGNAPAYDLYLKLLDPGNARAGRIPDLDTRIKRMKEVVALDPSFMPAVDLLSQLHSMAALRAVEPEAHRAHATEAKRWGETASRLMSGGVGDAALAFYYAIVEPDNIRSVALAENVVRVLPNHSGGHISLGTALHRAGRLTEALQEFRRAHELDPLEPSSYSNALFILARLRRKDEWMAALEQARAFAPNVVNSAERALERYRLTGDMPASLDRLPTINRVDWLWRSRRFSEVLGISERGLASTQIADQARFALLERKCDSLRRLGRTADADEAARALLALAEKMQAASGSDRSNTGSRLAVALARAGRTDEAIALGRRYAEAMSPSNQVADRWERDAALAELYAHAGRPREGVELLTKLLQVPGAITVPVLRVSPDWDNLREDAAFKALLADPKNSAPL